jgi:glycosyltransferase involved in cell wall biosynthesis
MHVAGQSQRILPSAAQIRSIRQIQLIAFVHTEDVTGIVTAMTDGERPFLADCLNSVISDPGIAQVIVCIQDSNLWMDEVLKSVRNQARLQILRLPSLPPGNVRNEALKQVKTEWIAYCDGDDVWCRGKTATQRAHAAENECDFVGGDHFLTDESGRVRAVALAMYLPMTSSWMVRAQTMRDYPFEDEKYVSGIEDHNWWFKTKGQVRKSRCPHLVLRYRVRQGSLSTPEPSKARKMKAVAIAKIPVVGLGVLLLTWCAWLVNRQKTYRPLLK